ncbi:MAG TPA: N-acetylmuramoyl-L-alanine amidase [Ignavibacteriaceae bacterium]|nr:N-acetylmuramoyl-L-alanine amidase [Ignavibacteriaceae bacterium]
MKIRLVILTTILLALTGFAQKSATLELINGANSSQIPVYERYSTVYFALDAFAKALSLNSYYNSQSEKIELKFKDYNLKFTASNPFIVLTSTSDNNSKVYQLPTSTYLIKGEIYVPLKYSLQPLEIALDKNLVWDDNYHLVLTTRTEKDKSLADIISNQYGISGISIDEKANGTLIRVKANKKIGTYKSDFNDGVLTIIFRDVHADIDNISEEGPGGLVKNIRVRNIGNDTEFSFTVGKEFTTSEVLNANKGNDILITLHNKVFETVDANDKNKDKWNFDVIVIDAGHGGVDPGTIGVGGLKEKNITLGIALKLGKLIEKNIKDVKVVYTRKSDEAVDLYKRGKIANENNGKLFISIHCNSTPHKPSNASGFEVYLLRPGRTEEAIAIAERENSVIQYEDNPQRYQKLTDENFILVSMAQSAYMKYSEEFSDLLNRQMETNLNIGSKGIKQAGFYVLVGASMPSVLIETGFLSNYHDANILKTQKGQSDIAESIYEAVKRFKSQYERSLNSE